MKRYFRLGLYDPTDAREPVELTGPVFTDSQADRAAMADVVRRYNATSSAKCHCCISAFRTNAAGKLLRRRTRAKSFYRLALVRPRRLSKQEPDLTYFGPTFENTPCDREVMRHAIAEWRRLRAPRHSYAVVLVKVKVIEQGGQK